MFFLDNLLIILAAYFFITLFLNKIVSGLGVLEAGPPVLEMEEVKLRMSQSS
jgi:hypothetical protein